MTTLIESNKKSSGGGGGGAGPTNRTSNVLTAIEPLSLPSVVGSKALFGNANNTDKTQGKHKTCVIIKVIHPYLRIPC